jgi:hypothetical protein
MNTLSYGDVVGITCGIMECNGIIYHINEVFLTIIFTYNIYKKLI